MELAYNIEQEVTQEQFKVALSEFSGYIAHRKTSSKFFIKPMTVKRRILQIMSNELTAIV
jgi:type 1 glutamine amidotransferase